MGSRLYVDTRKHISRFRKTGRGKFALAEPQQPDIYNRINTLNQRTKNELLSRLHRLAPKKFEVLIGELLIALGFVEETVEVTSRSGDRGVDVRGLLKAGGVADVNVAVQAKRWKRNVQAQTVQNLRGSLRVHEHGIVITTSGFSPGAEREAQEQGKTRIGLIDGNQLIDLLIRHEIGITSEVQTLHSLDDEWWGEIADEAIIESETQAAPPPAPFEVSYPLAIRGISGEETVEAILLDEDRKVEYRGKNYPSPSAAAKDATGWKAVNGWTYWTFLDPRTGEWTLIDKLR